MRSIDTKIRRVIVGKVEPNEDLIDAILEMVKYHDIKSGLVNCIGALKEFTLGYFDIESKQYKNKTFNEYVELVSCVGNIAYKDGEPLIHLHVSVGTRDYKIIGGHLNKPSIISVTGEVCIIEIDQQLNRANDPRFNLSLLNI